MINATVPVATQAEAEAGAIDDKAMTPLRVKQAIDALGVSQDVLASSSGGEMVGATDALNTTINLAMALPKREAFASQNGLAAVGTDQATSFQTFVDACAAAKVVAVLDRPLLGLASVVELPDNAEILIKRGCWVKSLVTKVASDRHLFDVQGDNISISVEAGCFGGFDYDAIDLDDAEDRRMWAVRVRGYRQNVTLTNVWCYNHSRLFCDTDAVDWASVGFGINTPTNIRVIGGGVIFRGSDLSGGQTSAVDMLAYVDGFAVIGSWYRNCQSFIQWWGGDAAASPMGDFAAQRKCRDGLIANIQGDISLGGGIWGSLGENIRLVGCVVKNCKDIGIDFEGCKRSSATGCTSIDGHNGCFATFFLCDGIDFENCHSISTDVSHAAYVSSNVAQSTDNMNISFSGGSYRGVGCLPLFASFGGPCRNWAIRGVTFDNIQINGLNSNNNVQIVFTDNVLTWDVAASGTRPILVDIGGHGNTGGGDAKGPRITVKGNTLRSWVSQPAETVGLRVTVAGENATGRGLLALNDIDGIPIPAIFESYNGNVGVANYCRAFGNTFDVGILGKTAGTFIADAGTDVVTHAFPRIETGSRFRLTNSGGALPAGLATGTDYYWIRVSQTTGKFATSETNANAGTAIDITDAGTGTHTMVMGVNVASITSMESNATFAGTAIS